MTTTTSTASTSSATVAAKPNVTSILGAGSGIDIQSLSTGLTEAERAPAKAVIDKRIANSTANISGYSAIKYVLGNLQTAFAGLKDQSSFNSLTPVNSQPSALSVTTGATALNGSHTVEVTQLAAAQRTVSAGFPKGTTPLNGGAPFNVMLSVHGAAPTSIAVTDPTPRGLAYAINQAGVGVSAQIVNTGDAEAPYKIMFTGTTGEANDFTLTGQAMPGSPAVATTQGTADPTKLATESSTVTFGSGLAKGQSMTVGGLTYTATNTVGASELAAAFASLENGATTGAGTLTGNYSGVLNGFATGAASIGNAIIATSITASSDVTDLRVVGTAPVNGSPTVTNLQGDATTTEAATVAFGSGLNAGQTVTVGGLSYTATSALSPAQLAAAFATLTAGATTGAGAAKGTYSGTLTGFSTGAATANAFTATSTTLSTNVSDLTVTTSIPANIMPAIAGLDLSTIKQSAANAKLTVDGVDIVASSNQVQDAVAGVTLNLQAKTTAGTPATLSFSRDTTAVTTKLQALVTAYNDAVSMLNVVSDPTSSVADYGASLVGNSMVGQVRNQIRTMVLGGASANAPASGSVKALRDLGVSIDSKGVLSLDNTKLGTTLSSSFDNAVTMLSANRENQSIYSTLDGGIAGNAVRKITAMLASTAAISTNSANATTNIEKYKKDLVTLEARMSKLKERYLKQFAAMDSIVGQSTTMRTSMQATYDGMMATYTNK